MDAQTRATVRAPRPLSSYAIPGPLELANARHGGSDSDSDEAARQLGQLLLAASCRGDAAEALRLLAGGADVNVCNKVMVLRSIGWW